MTQADWWNSAVVENWFVSAIWQIPGFHLSCIRQDWMHTVDLGTLQYLSGNCMWEAFREVGGSFKQWKGACGRLQNLCDMCAKRLGLEKPFHSLTIQMFRSKASSKPKMKLKAAEGRHFLPVLREVLATCFSMVTVHEQTRLQAVDALLDAYRLLENWNADSPHQFARHIRRHLILLCDIRANQEDPLLWCLFPKHHLLIHLAESSFVNPRLEWNYGDEDEIGRAVGLSKYTSSAHMATSLLARYRATFEL